MESRCICQKNNVIFVPDIVYKNETYFSDFEGTIIGRCTKCAMLKTFPAKANRKFDPQQSRAKFYEAHTQRFENIFKPIIDTLKKHKPDGTVLDVGCSSGVLLSLLKKRRYRIRGIEPNKNAYMLARQKFGSAIYNGVLDTFVHKNKTKFDVVIYNHVLEHIQDPVQELTLARSILKPDGVLIIGVPNARNFVRFFRNKKWELLMPNEHVWQFSDRHLVGLLTRLGFRTLELQFDNDLRVEYPPLKQLYFRLLIGLNMLFHTGEVLLLTARKRNEV